MVDPEILQRLVAEWVDGAALPKLTPREQDVTGLERPGRILAVVGPRRAGKTWFLYQIIGEMLRAGRMRRDRILFVDFEDYRLGGMRSGDVDGLLAAFHRVTGGAPAVLCFDEVQRLPDWSRVLRTLHNSRRYRIVVSGSNSELLASGVATELRGRYEDRLILPFSFREVLRFRGVSWTRTSVLTPERGRVERAFGDYLRRGGFPEVAGLGDEAARRRLLQSYYDTVFYRDMVDRHGIRARHLLDLMMRGLLEGYAAPFSISRFERQLKGYGQSGSKRSIAEYLRGLEEAFFAIATEKFDFSPRRRMMNPRRVYLMDTGFAQLGGSFTPNRGRLLENVVAIEFRRRRRRALYFKGRRECDFVVQEGTKPVEAWQVCWRLTGDNEERETEGLREAMDELGVRRGGILTYAEAGSRRIGKRSVPVIPVWRWLLEAEPS